MIERGTAFGRERTVTGASMLSGCGRSETHRARLESHYSGH